MNKPMILALAVAAALVLGGCSGGGDWHSKDITGVMPDLQFTLTNENQQTVHAGDYAGKVALVYFGFTHCPDVCPATLATVAQALDQLGEQAQQVRVLFVSVDPKRDSPQSLARYTNAFAPQVVGLTGSTGQLTELTKRYRVAFSYGQSYPKGQYDVYHSSAIFVFDRTGDVRLLMDDQDGPDAIADDLAQLLS